VNPQTAGVDIGAHEIMAGVPTAPWARSPDASKGAWGPPKLWWRRRTRLLVRYIICSKTVCHTTTSGAAEYNKRFRERELQYLPKKAARLYARPGAIDEPAARAVSE
jgi:hypothetical protein